MSKSIFKVLYTYIILSNNLYMRSIKCTTAKICAKVNFELNVSVYTMKAEESTLNTQTKG